MPPRNLWQDVPEVTKRASAGNSPLKQGIRQLKALMFVGAGIKDHQRTRTETFNFADGVLAKPTPVVEAASMCEDMSPAGSVDVEVDRLLTDRTLRKQRMKSPPNQQLYELRNPYG